MPASYDWIYPALGYPLAALSLLWLLLALFRDRSRGRRRCPRCWYDLAGVPSLTCPECGRTVRSERRLLKTRRRYRRAALATLLVLAGLAVTLVPAYQRGWPTAIPSWILVRVAAPRVAQNPPAVASGRILLPGPNPRLALAPAPPAPSPSITESLVRETWDRFNNAALSGSQYRCWLRRCMRAAQIDLAETFAVPDAWPEDARLQVLSNLPYFPGFELLELRVRAPELGPDWVAAGASASNARSQVLSLPSAGRPLDRIRLEVRLVGARAPGRWTVVGGTLTRPPTPSIADRVVYSTDLTLPLRVRGGRTDFLDTVSGPEADALVLAALEPRVTGTDYLRLTWNDTSDHPRWAPIDFAIFFRADLLVDDREVGRTLGHADWGRAVWKDWEDAPIAWEYGGREAFENASADPGAGTAHIVLRADHQAAAAAYIASPFYKPRPACWSGTLDLPARLAPRPRTSSRDP